MTLRGSLVCLSALVLVSAGCKEEESDPPGEDVLLEPPAEGEGVQYRMVTKIEAGTEVEQCQFFRAPPEGLNINSDDIRFTDGSHHVLLYLTPYTEVPTENDAGEAIDNSKPFDCSEGVQFDWTIQTLVAGSQNADGGSIVDFPPNVAMKVPGDAVLLMNVHYINAQSEAIEPEVRINVNTIPDEEVEIEGGLLFWYNAFIKVDPMGEGTARMSCEVASDITLRNVQSHMHRRGADYAATLLPPEGSPDVIYENTKWEGVPVKRWEEGLAVEAGTRIEYFCGYQNAEDRTVWQGPRSTDEMCMFIGSYWPVRPETSLCATDPADVQNTQNLAAEWVGNGDSTCGQTLACIQTIDPEEDFLHGLTDCILASDPGESKYVSDGVRCLLTHANPVEDCEAEIQACLEH